MVAPGGEQRGAGWTFLSRSPPRRPSSEEDGEVERRCCKGEVGVQGEAEAAKVGRSSEAKGRSPASLQDSRSRAVPPPPRAGRRPAPASPGKSPPSTPHLPPNPSPQLTSRLLNCR